MSIPFPSQEELRLASEKRFAEIRNQQALDRAAAQPQAEEIFGEGTLGRVEEGRSEEISGVLQQRANQLSTGASGLDEAIARRRETISTGGSDPALRQIEEAATRAQDVQTQTSLRQLRGDLGAQGVRGGINIQNQLRTLGGANLAQSQLQSDIARARLSRVSEAESAEEGLQRSRISQQQQALGAQESSLVSARAEEAGRAETNTQRALQERLGRLQLVETRAQAGTIERAAASSEVTAQENLRAQIAQQNEANRIALIEAQRPAAQPVVQESGGGTVLCTEMNRQGLISNEVLAGDLIYAETVAVETKIGYWVWAKPLARKCSTSKVLTFLCLPFVKAWATEMAYRVGKAEKGSFLGKLMTKIGEPGCNLLGKTLLKLNLVNLERITLQVTSTSKRGV